MPEDKKKRKLKAYKFCLLVRILVLVEGALLLNHIRGICVWEGTSCDIPIFGLIGHLVSTVDEI